MDYKIIIPILKTAYARAYVRIKGMNRDVTHFIADVALPFLGVSAIIFAYKAMGATNELLALALIGGSMIAFWYNVLWSMGMQLYWDKEQGNLAIYIISPAPLVGILLGMAIGGAFSMSLRAISILIGGVLLFNIKLNFSLVLPAFLIFILTLFSLYSLGMFFASYFLKFGRSVYKLEQLLAEPILFLSGVYFPIKVFPAALQILISLIPLAIGIEGMRRILVFGESLLNLYWIILLQLFLGIFFFILAVKFLKYMEKSAKVDGKLALKWE